MFMKLPSNTILNCALFGTRRVTARIIRLRRDISCLPMKRRYSGSEKPLFLKKPRKMEGAKIGRRIQLTAREDRLMQLLLDVARYIDESKEIKEKLELRFAGGWVRDKLLGIPSHDVDTAINAMTGAAFSSKMQTYLKDEENMRKHSLDAADLNRIYKIAANPEKSKHLETATTKIFGLDVDFTNLRKETYSQGSRNPQMEFGTAEEDALRRDATINALFYNLHSNQIEDFTGGLEDLKAKHLRTPLDPEMTFMDDPLRVLRLIRFASRFSFAIDSNAEASMGNPAVLEALKLKISRERVGIELEKMLKEKNPQRALQLIDRLGLYSTIFTDPWTEGCPAPETSNWYVAYDCLEVLKSNESPGSIYRSLVRSEDAKYQAWLLAALVPWSSVPQTPLVKQKGKALLPIGGVVAREGIKADNRICSIVGGAFTHYQQIIELKNAIIAKQSYTSDRGTIGIMIRKWDSQGANWRLQALFAILVEAMNMKTSTVYEELFGEWQSFIDHLEAMEIMDAPSVRPLLSGTELSRALGGVKPGPWMKPALDICIEWQLRNPSKKDATGAIEEVKKCSEQLKIPITH